MAELTAGGPDAFSAQNELIVRAEQPGDRNFIISTWLKCYRRHSSFTKNISNDVYFDWHQKVIKRLFDRGAVAHIAALKEDPLVILGYLITEHYDPIEVYNPYIHFAYVKFSFRNAGIMRTLLSAARIDLQQKTEYTHHTYEIEPIVSKHPKLVYNPYFL